MKRFAILLFFLFATAAPAFSQCAPLGGLANLQWFANDGTVLQNGALYFFVAQSSTQAPTYSDSQCSQLNVNPLPFAQGARTTVWVPAGNFKMVLCSSSTDGPFCASGDQLFVIDNLPGASSGSGGGGAPFISNTPSPATSGVLRLASGDSICWRNAAGSANLCFSKSSSDILQWSAGSFQLPEIAAPTCGLAGTDCVYADNTAHRLKQCSNGATCTQVVASGNDIGSTDQVLGVHFGSSQQTFGNTAPTSGQVLSFNGTNIIGSNAPAIIYNTATSEAGASFPNTTLGTVGGSNINYTLHVFLIQTVGTAGCSVAPTLSVQTTYSDPALNQTITLAGQIPEALHAIECPQGPHEEGGGSVSEIFSQTIRHLFGISD